MHENRIVVLARKILFSGIDETCETGRKMSSGHLFCADRSGTETCTHMNKK